MSIGTQIKSLREEKGMSRSDLSAKLGVNYNAISQYELNLVTPSFKVIIEIMKALECDANALFIDYQIENCENTDENILLMCKALNKEQKNVIHNVIKCTYESNLKKKSNTKIGADNI